MAFLLRVLAIDTSGYSLDIVDNLLMKAERHRLRSSEEDVFTLWKYEKSCALLHLSLLSNKIARHLCIL